MKPGAADDAAELLSAPIYGALSARCARYALTRTRIPYTRVHVYAHVYREVDPATTASVPTLALAQSH